VSIIFATLSDGQQYEHNRGVTNCDDAYPLGFTDLESSKI